MTDVLSPAVRQAGDDLVEWLFTRRGVIGILIALAAALVALLFILSLWEPTINGWKYPLDPTDCADIAIAVGTFSLAYATMVLAESAERTRRFENFPRVRVMVKSPFGAEARAIREGQKWRLVQAHLLADDYGNGPAFDIDVVAECRLLDSTKLEAATVQELASLPWEPTGFPAQRIDRLDRGQPVDLEFPQTALRPTSTVPKPVTTVAVRVTLSWTDAENKRSQPLRTGLKLLAGTAQAGDMLTNYEWVPLDSSDLA